MRRKAVAGLLLSAVLMVTTGCGNSAQNTAFMAAAHIPAQNQNVAEGTAQGFEVEFFNTSYDSFANDGTMLYLASFTRPQVTIPGNKAVEDKINAYMTEMEKAFKEQKKEFDERSLEAYENYKKVSAEPYNLGYNKEKGWDEDYKGWEASRSVMPELVNDDVISFRIEDFELLAGAANGSNIIQGVTFNAKTGDVMGLPDIFTKDLNGGLSYIEGKVLKKLETEYKDVLLDDYKDHIGDFEVMNSGTNWYLTKDGFVAVLQETTAAAHVAGTIETTVPWGELGSFR